LTEVNNNPSGKKETLWRREGKKVKMHSEGWRHSSSSLF